jgi:hypothetical protein
MKVAQNQATKTKKERYEMAKGKAIPGGVQIDLTTDEALILTALIGQSNPDVFYQYTGSEDTTWLELRRALGFGPIIQPTAELKQRYEDLRVIAETLRPQYNYDEAREKAIDLKIKRDNEKSGDSVMRFHYAGFPRVVRPIEFKQGNEDSLLVGYELFKGDVIQPEGTIRSYKLTEIRA